MMNKVAAVMNHEIGNARYKTRTSWNFSNTVNTHTILNTHEPRNVMISARNEYPIERKNPEPTSINPQRKYGKPIIASLYLAYSSTSLSELKIPTSGSAKTYADTPRTIPITNTALVLVMNTFLTLSNRFAPKFCEQNVRLV